MSLQTGMQKEYCGETFGDINKVSVNGNDVHDIFAEEGMPAF